MAFIEEKNPLPSYTRGEEILNSVSHGVGALFGVAGTAVLVVWCALHSDARAVASGAVYGFTLILLYTMSTLYHAITDRRVKKVLRILDHATIYLLIAGTYTPYALVTLRGTAIGWVVFGLTWGVAVLGVTLSAVGLERFKKLSMVLYILAGWAALVAMKPIWDRLPLPGLLLMLLGGVFYTGGLVFYALKRRRYFHGIWHFFVLAGSVAHYFSVLLYVVR